MTFAALPLALLISACVIPPLILLYFLKLRRQERAVPSTLLWFSAVQDLQANAPFQKLKPNILLFLQLLALLLLLLAIAQPQWVGQVSHGSRTILVIDRSASMTTALEANGSRTRLDQAKEEAIDYINAMNRGGFFNPLSEPEKVMVISFSDHATVNARFTSSKTQLIKAVKNITPTHGSTKLKEALQLARAYAVVTNPENAGRSLNTNARLILFSDGRIQDIQSQVAREPISYRKIGANSDQNSQPLRNAGIVAFDAQRNYKDMSTISVYARVANYQPYPTTASLLFSVGDQLVASPEINLPPATLLTNTNATNPQQNTTNADSDTTTFNATPGLTKLIPATVDVTLDFAESRGIMLGAELDYRDDMKADNRAFVVVPPAKQLNIALVNSSIFVLQSALSGIPFIKQIHRMTGEQFEQLQNSGKTQQYDLIILDDYQPEHLLPGRYLTFGKLPPIEGYGRIGTDRKWNLAVTWDSNHPVNHDVNYSQLNALYLPTKSPDNAKSLVDGDKSPIITEISENGVHAIIIPFTLRESNWPWDVNFVFFLQNAVDYLGHLGDAVASESFHPGDALVARLPADATDIHLHFPDPDNRNIKLQPSDPSYTTYDPIELTGLYQMTWKTPDNDTPHSRAFAVNMFNLLEGDIRPAPALQFPGDPKAVASIEGKLKKRALWPYALIACLLVLTLEWWVYGRRAYI